MLKNDSQKLVGKSEDTHGCRCEPPRCEVRASKGHGRKDRASSGYIARYSRTNVNEGSGRHGVKCRCGGE